MKTVKSIDIKSMMIGLLIGLCAVFAAAASRDKQNEVGRYRIVCSANGLSCMVLDSRTGRVWHKSTGSNKGRDWGCPDEWKR